MKYGFVIPVYRHADALKDTACKLSSYGYPVILIDDGNSPADKASIAQTAAKTPGAVLVSLEKNSGKGGAFKRGIEKAAEMELSHVFQIDADGQHDFKKINFFLEESRKYPDKVICGYPVFSDDAPKSRVKGRKISNFWGAVVTLSLDMKDLLCGYRIYPLKETRETAKHLFLNKRMGFDPEILVRLYWKKVYPMFIPIDVSYPQEGVSNFRVIRDNLAISFTFSRLCIGMFARLPLLLIRKIRRKSK